MNNELSTNEGIHPISENLDFYDTKVELIHCDQDMISKVTRARFLRCFLTDLPKGLSSYTNIRNLDLSGNMLEIFDSSAIYEWKELKYLDLSVNNLIKIDHGVPFSITILDLSFNSNLDLQSLWELYLPNLEQVNISCCNVKNLPEGRPSWATTLRRFFLDGNYLKDIPGFIKDLPLIEEVHLSGNCIENISFSNSNHPIKTLNLQMNANCSFEQNSGIAINTLFLNYSIYNTIHNSILSIMGLSILRMWNCSIEGVLDFQIPQQLSYIDFSNNKITGISPAFASSIFKLSHLNLSNNLISDLPDSFPENSCLSQVCLSNNILKKLPKSFLFSRSIEKLLLDNNCIESLEAFSYPQLRELCLSHNKITTLPDCFEKCTYLHKMNFSFNQLDDLPKTMCNCRRVSEVNLSCNKYVSIPKTLMAFGSIKMLIVSGNRLTNLPKECAAFFFIRKLDLSNNHMTQVPSVISNISELRYLSLSHNRISSFPEGFTFPPNLSYLDLSFNLLFSIPPITIQTLVSVSFECNMINNIQITDPKNLIFCSINGCQMKNTEMFLQNLSETCNNDLIVEYINPQFPSLLSIRKEKIKLFKSSDNIVKARFGVGYVSTPGGRSNMEDSVCIKFSDTDDLSVFGVFDGHAGYRASEIASETLWKRFENQSNLNHEQICQCFSDSFDDIQETIKQKGFKDGTTAACCLLFHNTCFYAAIGDSRIVKVNRCGYERLTYDHKPTDYSEYSRLKNKGIGVNNEFRVLKNLAVSRAIGDLWCPHLLYETPSIKSFQVSDDDLYLIIACDGLWDVISDESASDIVRVAKSPQDAATSLKNFAFACESADNISIIVIDFHPKEETKGFSFENTVEEIPIFMYEAEREESVFTPPLSGRRRR